MPLSEYEIMEQLKACMLGECAHQNRPRECMEFDAIYRSVARAIKLRKWEMEERPFTHDDYGNDYDWPDYCR